MLKVFRPATEEVSVEREVRALTDLTPGRLTRLFDVGTLADGRSCLVLEQLTGGALSSLLEGRGLIRPGEAVTILAPVAAALAELQSIGLVHRAVSLSTIVFGSDGRPVVTGLGQLRALPTAGPGRTEALDLVQGRVARVVRAVLDQVDSGGTAPAAFRDLDRWCAAPSARSAAGGLDELEHLLFAWAEALPVRLGQTPAPEGAMRAPGDWLRHSVPDAPSGWGLPGEGRVAVAAPRRARRMLGSLASQGRAVIRRLRRLVPAGEPGAVPARRIRLRRGPLLLAAVVAVVGTGWALTVPAPDGLADIRGARPGAATPPPAGTSGDTAAPAETSAAGDGDGDGATVHGDDPAAAVPALLRIRARCLAEVSVVCLDGVHQPMSAALAADTHTLRMIQQGEGTPDREDLGSWAAVLVERTGDVALVSLQAAEAERQPASVLVVRGEAGWRIRDIFDY